MSLQLILGGSGSGKTTFLQDAVIRASVGHPQQLYFMIVPEQFTMQTQKDIVTRHPQHGTMNIDIVSFERLAYRVFEELAVENLEILDDMGKSMVLRKVAANERRRLVLFSGHLGQTGFINQMKSMLSEFYQYGISPQILREMAPQARTPLLRQKLEDFAVVFEGFQSYIEGHYITTEEVLDVLCRVIPESKLVRGSVIALDGYTGFTPVQYRLLELLLCYAKQVIVTVTADRQVPVYEAMGEQKLFYMSHQMVCKLSELAEKNQVKKLDDIWMKETPRFLDAPELGWLEQNLFRYRSGHYKGEMTGALELYQGNNPAGEISHVVRRMLTLIREDGLRFRDMAVVTGDLAGYGKEIAHQFEQNGIPYFMDDRKNLLSNPMVELLRAAMEVIRRDFSYETVFRYLRTGLVTQDELRLDRMENYVLALGIRGFKRWSEVWERTWRGGASLNLTELNEFRDEVMAPLFAMRERFKEKEITVSGMVEAVRGLLADCRIEEKMTAWQEYFEKTGELRLAKEYGQAYGLVTELLARLEGLLGDEIVSRKEFAEILDAGFAEISVGVIPATVDRVVVGDITRTRLAHIKVLFFVGVNDGIVPMRKDSGSLLSDKEREFFGEHKIVLAPTAREDSFRQRFYLYLMMTKPSGKLIVTYAGVGGDGKSRRASYLVGELRKMFPALELETSEAHAGMTDHGTTETPANAGTADSEKLASLPDKTAADCGGTALPSDAASADSSKTASPADSGQRKSPSDAVYSVPEAYDRLILGLRHYRDGDLSDEERRHFLELYRWFFSSDTYREDLRRLVNGAFYVYEKQGIGHAVARALYGTILSGSVTRLEKYAECAYAHFLQYGLELMERQHYELAAADIGNLFHDSIDLCFKKVKEGKMDWRQITDREREKLVHAAVEAVTSDYGNTILGSSSRNAYLAKRVEQITQRTVWALQQQIIRGDFEPAGFEVAFSAADHLDALNISLSKDEALRLRGRIDRMDTCVDGGQVFVKIIDYKSGSTSFDLVALYYGLQLQLVVYMDAVMELTAREYPGREIVPAGIFYYNIADPVIQKNGQPDEEMIQAEILRKLRMNGLINSELEAIHHLDNTIEKESDIIPVVLKDGAVQEAKSSVANRERFDVLRKHVRRKLQAAGREILDGEVGTEPYKSGNRTACDYCPYHAVCGFDKKTAGYEYRKLRNRKTEEIWEELCQENQ